MGSIKGDKVLEVDYPMAFAYAFVKTLPAHAKPFRFVHLCVSMAETDQNSSLFYMESVRKAKVSLLKAK